MKTSQITLLSGAAALMVGVILAITYIRVASGNLVESSGSPRDSGENIIENRELRDFNGIVINGAWRVEVKQGDGWNVELDYPEKFAQYIEVSVDNEKLVLDLLDVKPSVGDKDPLLKATITMPELTSLEIAGTGDVKFRHFSGEQLHLMMSGAANIEGYDGHYKGLEIHLGGAGRVNMKDIEVRDANVNLAGTGDVEVTMAGGILSGSLAGVGSIRYHGSIKSNEVGVFGIGAVVQMN